MYDQRKENKKGEPSRICSQRDREGGRVLVLWFLKQCDLTVLKVLPDTETTNSLLIKRRVSSLEMSTLLMFSGFRCLSSLAYFVESR
jgi:hypothetical protein